MRTEWGRTENGFELESSLIGASYKYEVFESCLGGEPPPSHTAPIAAALKGEGRPEGVLLKVYMVCKTHFTNYFISDLRLVLMTLQEEGKLSINVNKVLSLINT